MGNRLSKIVTKTGDDGTTGIAKNIRLPKYHVRIEAIGMVDELNSLIGVGLAYLEQATLEELSQEWIMIQHHLFNLGGELAMPEMSFIDNKIVTKIEDLIVNYNETLTPLKEFILPTGSILISHTHLLRSVTRRVERVLSKLNATEPLNPYSLQLINRLSDYFFICARIIAKETHTPEVYWDKFKV